MNQEKISVLYLSKYDMVLSHFHFPIAFILHYKSLKKFSDWLTDWLVLCIIVRACLYCGEFLWTKWITSIWMKTEIDSVFSVSWSKKKIWVCGGFASIVSWSRQCCVHLHICNHKKRFIVLTAWSCLTRVWWKTSSHIDRNNTSLYECFYCIVPFVL
jgi:hypothetical protein